MNRKKRGIFSPQGIRAIGISLLPALFIPFVTISAQESPDPRPRQVRGLAFSPDGSLLAAAGGDSLADGRLILWKTDTFQLHWQHDETVGFARLAFSPDGRELALARFAPEAKLFDVASGEVTGELGDHPQYARSVAYSPDGERIVTGSYDRAVHIWNVANRELVSRLFIRSGPIYHVAISPDGILLATADARDGAATLWNLTDGTQLHRFERLGSLVPHVAFSPDGGRLVVSSWTGGKGVFDTSSYNPLARIEGIGGGHWAEYSPDGRWLAVVTNSVQVRIFREDRTKSPQLQARVEQLLARFDEDSYEAREQASHELAEIGPAAETQLLEALDSPSPETRIRARRLYRRLYDPAFSIQLRGHQDELECVTFSPDGKLLASGDRVGTIIVWRVADWQPVATLSLQD
jgi:WD40 repeat protein